MRMWGDLSVHVPEIPFPLDDAAFNRMKSTVNLLEESSCYGIDVYAKSWMSLSHLLQEIDIYRL